MEEVNSSSKINNPTHSFATCEKSTYRIFFLVNTNMDSRAAN